MTVRQLSENLTIEELVGWAAFYEIKSEEEEKAMDNATFEHVRETLLAGREVRPAAEGDLRAWS